MVPYYAIYYRTGLFVYSFLTTFSFVVWFGYSWVNENVFFDFSIFVVFEFASDPSLNVVRPPIDRDFLGD